MFLFISIFIVIWRRPFFTRDGAVYRATTLRVGRPRKLDSRQEKEIYFFPKACKLTLVLAQTWTLSLGIKWTGIEPDHSDNLELKCRMSGDADSLLSHAFMVYTRTTLFTFSVLFLVCLE